MITVVLGLLAITLLSQARAQATESVANNPVTNNQVAITDLMVNAPEAELDALARQYLQQVAPNAPTPPTVTHRAMAPSAGVTTKSVASSLDISEVKLSRKQWLNEVNRQADTALANNNWPLAEVTLAQALGEFSDAHKLRLRLASLMYGRGALSQASQVLQQGLHLAPQQPDLRLTLARLLAEQGRYSAALQLLNEAQPPLAEHLDYYSLKADMARRSNQCHQAITTYQQLLTHSRVGAWWLGLGLCQRELGEDFSSAFLQARASADLGQASQRFVEQQLTQLQQGEHNVQTQAN
ncbi:tetratricopeptide repeat protein [Oceanisphaera pacifica]|nr:tetratricopeptide repeat protein [Oceanisphaera pacifica]